MAKAKRAADAAPVAEAATQQTQAAQVPPAGPPPGYSAEAGGPASATPTPPKKRAKPLGYDQHCHMATGVLGLLDDLRDLVERVEEAYGTTTQAPRAARAMVRDCEELRAALSSRFFTDVRPRNGLTPYYPPEPPPTATAAAEVVETHQDDEVPEFNAEV